MFLLSVFFYFIHFIFKEKCKSVFYTLANRTCGLQKLYVFLYDFQRITLILVKNWQRHKIKKNYKNRLVLFS